MMHTFNVLIYYLICFIEVSLGTQDQTNSNRNYLKETLVNKSMLTESLENQATKELTDATHSKVKLKKRSIFPSDETFIGWAEDIFLVRPIDETLNRPFEGHNNVPFTENNNALNETEPVKEEAVKLLETKPLFVPKKKSLAKKGVINKTGNNNVKSKILKSESHQRLAKHDVNERPQQDMVVSNMNKSIDVVTEISKQPYAPSTNKYDELKSSVDSTTTPQSYVQTDSTKTSKTEISKQPYEPSTDKYDELISSVDWTTTPQSYVQTDSSETSKTEISKQSYAPSTEEYVELKSSIDSTTTQSYQTDLPKKVNDTNMYDEIKSSVDPTATSPSYQIDSPKTLNDTIGDKHVDKKPEYRALEDLVELYYKLAYTKRWNDVKELYKYLQKRLKIISEEDNNYFLDNRKRFHELIEHTKKHFKPPQKHVAKLRKLFVIYADEPVVATEVSDESSIIDEDFEKKLSSNVSKATTWGNKSTNDTDFSTLSYLFNNTQTTPDYNTSKVSSNMGNVETNFNQSKVEEYFRAPTTNNSSQPIKVESEFEKPKISTQSNTESEEMVENTENIISNGFIQAVTNTFKHVTIDSDSQTTGIDPKPDKDIKSISMLTADNEMEPGSLTGELQLKESQKLQPVSLIDSEVKTPVSELNNTESNEAIDTTVSQLITVTSTNSPIEIDIMQSHPTSFTPANTQTEFTKKQNIHSNIYQEDKEANNNKVLDTNSGTTYADDNNNVPSKPINEKGRRSLTTNSDIQLYAGGKMYILKPEQPYTDLTGIETVDIRQTNDHEDNNQYVTLSADVNTDTDNDLYFESSATLPETSTDVYNTFVMTDHDMPATYPNINEKQPHPVSAFGETTTKLAVTKIKDDNFAPHLQRNAENIIISSTNYQATGYPTKDSSSKETSKESITSAENIEHKTLDMKTTVDYSTIDKKHVENKTDPRTDKMNLQSEMTLKPNKINANFNQSYIKTSYLDFYKNIFGPLSDISAETINNESPLVFNASNVNKDNYLNKQTTVKDIYINDTLSLKNNITMAQLYKNLAKISYQFRDNTTPMAQTEQEHPIETTRKSLNTVVAITEKTANNSQIENYNVSLHFNHSNQITTEKIIVKKELNATKHTSKKLSEESAKIYRKFMNELKSVDRSIKPVNVSETTTERFLTGVDDENLAIGDDSQRIPLTQNNYIKTKNILQETLNTTKKLYNWFSHAIHKKRQKYIKEIKDVVKKYKELIKFQINPELDIDYQEVDKSRNKSNIRRLISTNESTLTSLNITKSNTTPTTSATSVNTVTDKTDSSDLEDMYNKRLKNVNIQDDNYAGLSKNRFESSGFNTDNVVSNDKMMYDKILVLKSADKSLPSNMRSSSDEFNSLISSLASRFVPEPWNEYKLRKKALNTESISETFATIDDASDYRTEAITKQEDVAEYTKTFGLNTSTKQPIKNNNHSIRRSCGIDKTLNADIVEGTVRRDLYPWLGVLYYPRYDEPLLSNVALVKADIAVSLMLDVLRYPKDDLMSLAVICFGQSCPETGVGLRNYSVRAEYRAEGFATTLVLLHLDLEKMEQKIVLIPICMPPHTIVTSKLYAMVPNEVYSRSTVKVYEMSYVTKSKCRAYYNKTELNVASLWPRHWVCARARAYTHECVWPNGVLLAVRQKDRWHLLGFGVTGPGCSAPARFVDYGQYHQWVDHNLVTDNPFYKVDHPLDKVDHPHDVVTALDKVGHAKVKTATKVRGPPARVDRNFVKGDHSFARAYRETNNSANGTNSEEIITIL